jgi:hypothetical protein
MHLPWSDGITDDDKVIETLDSLEGDYVVITEKMDGENTTMYRDHIHARSIDSKHHSSRDWVKSFHASIKHNIPEGWRVCGENVYAQHSIHYDNLPSYFLGFSIWNEKNECLRWIETMQRFSDWGIEPVPIIWAGLCDFKMIRQGLHPWDNTREGYVIRAGGKFHIEEFPIKVAKYVRKNHVQTDQHWMKGPVVQNRLA